MKILHTPGQIYKYKFVPVENPKAILHIDMDGVVCDFDAGIRALGMNPDPSFKNSPHNLHERETPFQEEMYDAIQNTTFFEGLPICEGATTALKRVMERGDVTCSFLTAAPKFVGTEEEYYMDPYWVGSAYGKRRWLEEYFLPAVAMRIVYDAPERVLLDDSLFVCTTSKQKIRYMKQHHSSHQVLIDDRTANCEAWTDAGGFAIRHDGDFDPTLETLMTYLDAIK